jgi:hypothetical protein
MTDAVETHTTKFKSPSSPEIGYLVKYQHVAVTLPCNRLQPIEPEDKPMTFEELQAMEEAVRTLPRTR